MRDRAFLASQCEKPSHRAHQCQTALLASFSTQERNPTYGCHVFRFHYAQEDGGDILK